jgi:hypothetical protein
MLATTSLPLAAHADPLMIKGYGGLSCGQVLAQNEFASEAIIPWIGGYATATENYMKIFEILPNAPHDTMALLKIVRQQFEAFPNKTLFIATAEIMNRLAAKQITHPAQIEGKTTAKDAPSGKEAEDAEDANPEPTQFTSLSDYAKHIKHRWVKYGEDGNQTSYIDLTSIIRTGDILTVLDMQDWNPPIEVVTTGEHLGSSLSLVRYDCGGTPRSMIMASVTFHGHMGSGTQQEGAADVPNEPFDGWHVMPARTFPDMEARAKVVYDDFMANLIYPLKQPEFDKSMARNKAMNYVLSHAGQELVGHATTPQIKVLVEEARVYVNRLGAE